MIKQWVRKWKYKSKNRDIIDIIAMLVGNNVEKKNPGKKQE